MAQHLLSDANVRINPATEDKQDTLLAALDRPMDASAYYHTRTALTGADQTIALGAAYHNIKVWLDSGASPCYIAVDAAANSDDPRIDDSVAYSRHFDADGVANIYIESTGAVGYINVEAW